MGQISSIIDGWNAYISGKNRTFVRQRAETCKLCPNAVLGTYEKLMPDFELKEIQGLKCSICKCPLSTKLRSTNEKCPLGLWE